MWRFLGFGEPRRWGFFGTAEVVVLLVWGTMLVVRVLGTVVVYGGGGLFMHPSVSFFFLHLSLPTKKCDTKGI